MQVPGIAVMPLSDHTVYRPSPTVAVDPIIPAASVPAPVLTPAPVPALPPTPVPPLHPVPSPVESIAPLVSTSAPQSAPLHPQLVPSSAVPALMIPISSPAAPRRSGRHAAHPPEFWGVQAPAWPRVMPVFLLPRPVLL